MKQEIEIAVKWWADKLRTKAKHNNGDALHNAMFSMIANTQKPIEEEKIKRFEEELTNILATSFEKNWMPETPAWDSYSRCIGVDYGPDGRLRDAADRAGIDLDDYRFPVKTNMWIDPGEVKVSCGYRAPIEILFAFKNP